MQQKARRTPFQIKVNAMRDEACRHHLHRCCRSLTAAQALHAVVATIVVLSMGLAGQGQCADGGRLSATVHVSAFAHSCSYASIYSSARPAAPSLTTRTKKTESRSLACAQCATDGTGNDTDSLATNTNALTSAVLNVTYDGSDFHGWTAGGADFGSVAGYTPPTVRTDTSKISNEATAVKVGKVRSVEGVMRQQLARLYGDVPLRLIQLEGCSRTDKGVHANSMIAFLYCLKEEATTCNTSTTSIPGKRIPHPSNATDDSHFELLPLGGDLQKFMYILNRMLPPDVRISNAAPMPCRRMDEFLEEGPKEGLTYDTYRATDLAVPVRPFHPTLDTNVKTYQYTFSVGHLHDPLRCLYVWHVPDILTATSTAKEFDLQAAQRIAAALRGRHDFAAFRGARRGSEKKLAQFTVCTLSHVSIEKESADIVNCVVDWSIGGVKVGGDSDEEDTGEVVTDEEALVTYTVTVKGDRFLYKMVRFLVGSMVAVGQGKLEEDAVLDALANAKWDEANNNKTPLCAPPRGLTLVDVAFDKNCGKLEWVW